MATIEVNKNKISFNSSDYLNIKSLLPRLQKEFPINVYKLAYLKINGVCVDVESDDPSLVRPIVESDHIQVNFDRGGVLLSDIVYEIHDLINKITIHIQKTVKNSDRFNDEMFFKNFSKIVESVNVFIQSITYVVKHLKCTNANFNNLPCKELQIHLLSILKALETAQSNEDHIMLADLLEYELKDNLTQWKVLIMPTLRKQAQINL